jgi:hypothetical protein
MLGGLLRRLILLLRVLELRKFRRELALIHHLLHLRELDEYDIAPRPTIARPSSTPTPTRTTHTRTVNIRQTREFLPPFPRARFVLRPIFDFLDFDDHPCRSHPAGVGGFRRVGLALGRRGGRGRCERSVHADDWASLRSLVTDGRGRSRVGPDLGVRSRRGRGRLVVGANDGTGLRRLAVIGRGRGWVGRGSGSGSGSRLFKGSARSSRS